MTYRYQMAADPGFKNIVFEKNTARHTTAKFEENEWFRLLEEIPTSASKTFYHRVLASDGHHSVSSATNALHLMKSDEALTDLAEVAPPNFKFTGKIEESGAGYGALRDNDNKIWLADYRSGLIINTSEGTPAPFSPLTSVEISGKTYALNPVNGIGKDLDGNILAGINRHLIKINAKTGQGIAVWEVPKGNRAITSPRAASDGTIYVMSLFGEDANFVLKQKDDTFELIKTLSLKNRHLSRTFDMSVDGRTLYFPDPGSALTQVYHSENGNSYSEKKPIRSLNAGSSALQVRDNALYFAVRSSGVSPSSFHYRNQEEHQMWTLDLPEVHGAEPRGIGVSPDGRSLIFCSWDKGGGYYLYQLQE